MDPEGLVDLDAVPLNGSQADPQPFGNEPRLFLSEEVPKHFELTVCQFEESRPDGFRVGQSGGSRHTERSCAFERGEKAVDVHGLFKEVIGSVSHGIDCGADVSVASDEDDWKSVTTLRHENLQVKAVHALHLDVEQDDSGFRRRVADEKAFGGFILRLSPTFAFKHHSK